MRATDRLPPHAGQACPIDRARRPLATAQGFRNGEIGGPGRCVQTHPTILRTTDNEPRSTAYRLPPTDYRLRPASPVPRLAFTLVELLVVVAIISMLLAILIPAVLGARERARVTQCANHLRNLAQAAVQFDLNQGHFPGYANRVSGYTGEAGWPVVLLKLLDRQDVWTAFRGGAGSGSSVRVDLFLCPSDGEADAEGPAMSYVGNCGQPDAGDDVNGEKFGDPDVNPGPPIPPDWAANGVMFRRHTIESAPAGWVKVSVTASDMTDGAQHTFLFSECYGPSVGDVRGGPAWNASPAMEKHFGFLWSQEPVFCKNALGVYEQIAVDAPVGVNSDSAPRIGSATGSFFWIPTSNHAGGVNVAYCDGHIAFLAEGVTYQIYALQMTPKGGEAWKPGTARSSDPTDPNKPPDWCSQPLDEE